VYRGHLGSLLAWEGIAVRILTRLTLTATTILLALALWAQPAGANTPVRTVIHVDETGVDTEICGFDITFHFFGRFTVTDFSDNTGFVYKTIVTVGPGGPFIVTATAKGTTLTQQNSSFDEIITYNADGSVNTRTDNGPYNKFTAPGGGIVWLDTGRIVLDGDFNILFEAGPRQHGEFDAFCAAFG
jgi:hypothetical protein